MSLRYVDKPYGQTSGDNWRSRFPAHAQPIATAPQNISQPIIVGEPSGQGYWALPHKFGWQKVDRSGRMTGEFINQPVAWWMPQRGK
jgi:hypothetical protein